MPAQVKRDAIQYPLCVAVALVAALALAAALFSAGSKPKQIRSLHREIRELQERLISAQITSRNLQEVQKVVEKNLAYSSEDAVAQGGSLSFLQDLTHVLDGLGIGLTSLSPESVEGEGRFLETPYEIEVSTNWAQFRELVNKMEKSPRLIAIKSFDIANAPQRFISGNTVDPDKCTVQMRLTTLTLVREE